MLRSSFGRSGPAPRALRAIRWTALAILALCLPGLASAASVTFDVLDPSGYGATVTLEDGEVPGTLNIEIEQIAPDFGIELVGNILGVYLLGGGDDPLLADLDASGADVDGVSAFTGPDYIDHLVDLGAGGIWALNDIVSTSFIYTHPTEAVSVAALAGTQLSVWIGFDSTNRVQTPGSRPTHGNLTVIKPIAEIPAIPEPGTAALMLLGLMGLSASSRRFGAQA